MLEPEDFYINENGLTVLTEQYHLKRGYCCENGCKHCPWNYGREEGYADKGSAESLRGKKQS